MKSHVAHLVSALFILLSLFAFSSSAFADDIEDDPKYTAPLNTGFYMDFGVGTGDILSHTAVFHIGAGFVWEDIMISDFIRFGTYFDLNVGAPAIFNMGSVALNIMPKLHFVKRNFQFSLGLGIGVELWGGNNASDEHDAEITTPKPSDPAIEALFSIKPNFEFDWFVTKNWFVGFAINCAFLFENSGIVVPSPDLYFQFGYKF